MRVPFLFFALAAVSISVAGTTFLTPVQSQVPTATSGAIDNKAEVLRTVGALAELGSADFKKKGVIERITGTRLQKFGVSPLKKDSTITQVRLQTSDDGSKQITGVWLTVNPSVRVSRQDVLQELAKFQSQNIARSQTSGDIVNGGTSRLYYRCGNLQIAFDFDAKDPDALRFVVFSETEKNEEPPGVERDAMEPKALEKNSGPRAFEPTAIERTTAVGKSAQSIASITPSTTSARSAPKARSASSARSAGSSTPASGAVIKGAVQLTGHFTCDNSYQVWIGTEDEVHTLLLEATNMTTVNIAQGEDLPPTTPEPGQYLYIVAWSDDFIYQGLIGAFKGDITILSGDSRWKVLPTGRNKHNKQFPKIKEINDAIEDGVDNWRAPTFGATNGGPPWNFPIMGIPANARWMWYDSNKDRKAKYPEPPYVPFGSGFNHEEFLVFRIPYQDFYSEQLAMSTTHLKTPSITCSKGID